MMFTFSRKIVTEAFQTEYGTEQLEAIRITNKHAIPEELRGDGKKYYLVCHLIDGKAHTPEGYLDVLEESEFIAACQEFEREMTFSSAVKIDRDGLMRVFSGEVHFSTLSIAIMPVPVQGRSLRDRGTYSMQTQTHDRKSTPALPAHTEPAP